MLITWRLEMLHGKILYIGSKTGTSLHRARALQRSGYDVVHISPYEDLPKHWALWLSRFGGPGLDGIVARSLKRQIGRQRFPLALVDSGDVVGPKALRHIRQVALKTANYCQDNPYGDPLPERRRWTLFRRAASGYDLLVTPRRENADLLVKKLTGKAPMQVWFSADEVAHRPQSLTKAETAEWSSDVIFAGAWMPGRDAFMAKLVEAGLPLKIYGLRWERSPDFERIRSAVQFRFLNGADYAKAIQGSKVALVLVNGANSDLHTTRSAEIPAIGAAMCAPRTIHHANLYRDGEEALFFDNADECIAQCRRLLADEGLRIKVASGGRLRTLENRTYNEDLMKSIVDRLSELPEVRA